MPSLKKHVDLLVKNKLYYWEIINDPAFDLKKVDEGTEDRMVLQGKEHLPRIIESYNKAKTLQADMPEAYQVGNEWLPIFEKYLSPVMQALKVQDLDRLEHIYSNFMRDDCSIGLHGLSLSMKKDFFSGNIKKYNKKKYLIDIIHRMHLWNKYYAGKYSFTDLVTPNIGNPYGITLDGQFLRTGCFYNHYYSNRIVQLLRSTGNCRKVVWELGAGYGGMAYYLCREKPNLTYIALDLPENTALTAYYLMTSFPNKKILLHGEDEITQKTIQQYDIILLPNCDLEKLPTESCDVIFNSYSLAEMSQKTIQLYIDHIMRCCRGYFIHINHNKNAKVVADDFGMDEAKFNLLYKIPALWNYGRNIHMDEYEYLYQKIDTL